MEILFCNTLLEVKIVYYVKIALNFIRFVIPIILILKISTDVYKSLINNDDKNNVWSKTPKRIIAAVIVFLVPTLIDALISLIGTATEHNYFRDNFATCYENASLDLIEQLENDEITNNS